MSLSSEKSLSFGTEALGYKPALDKAQKRLTRTSIEDITNRTGVKFDENEEHFIVTGLNQDYYVKYPSGEISNSNPELNTTVGMAIVILHFLLRGDNWPLRADLVSYRELPGGNVYNDAFQREAVEPIIDNFSEELDKLEKAAQKLGAQFIDKGDLGFSIEILPTIPLTYTVWAGDDEVPGGANVLFDSSIVTKLHTEDIAFLGEYLTHLLIKFSKK
ncbi:DUF3786 domain-containing protein [Fuchsiella alkaliacetigena]|uniref:DUF3786 domain-containing protein n=1 Tax=Fuchsiella alkaliacetigena TaxID=957042 RepID=UPI00200A5D80|nr:DUF3786 domain-containing protein [Fuchsiella alkaliacetigena]MCK8824933.1 DUF3786 domain-containing protein [Fuchsiella alkaliacetigena]